MGKWMGGWNSMRLFKMSSFWLALRRLDRGKCRLKAEAEHEHVSMSYISVLQQDL